MILQQYKSQSNTIRLVDETNGMFPYFQTELPVLLQCGMLLSCYNMSTKGSPLFINGSYSMIYSNLTTLEGAPLITTNTFYCYGNDLPSLKGGPVYVGGHYHCTTNPLNSLEGLPAFIGGDLYISTPPSSDLYNLSFQEFNMLIQQMGCILKGNIQRFTA